MTQEHQPIWYLPGPTHQYVEDVKALAREAGLRIIDANVTTDRSDAAENPPAVTLKPGAASASADDYVPTKAELMAAHERLMQMQADLDAERDRLHAQAAEQSAERARLADLTENLAAAKDASAGTPPALEPAANAAPVVTEPSTEAKSGRAARAK
jgi:hypothetical protein